MNNRIQILRVNPFKRSSMRPTANMATKFQPKKSKSYGINIVGKRFINLKSMRKIR